MRCTQLAGLSLTVVAVVVAAAGCSSSTHASSTQPSSSPVSSTGSTAAAATPSSPAATSAGSAEKSTGPSEPGGGYQLASAVTALQVNAPVASIDVTAQDSAAAISVREQLHGGASTTHAVTGSSATLTAHCPAGISFSVCRVDYTVIMPARVALTVEGSAGNVTLTGPLTTVTISTDAGKVTGTALGAGTYQVSTSAGTVRLAFAKPPNSVTVKSDVGQVTLTVPGSTGYAVTTDTTIGEQHVEVNRNSSSPHRINVSTTVGSITISKG